MDFTVKKVLRRVLRKGSDKGVCRTWLECSLKEYDRLGVRPNIQEFRGPLGPKSPEVSKKVFPGLPAWGVRKCRKGPEGPKTVSKKCQNQRSGSFPALS